MGGCFSRSSSINNRSLQSDNFSETASSATKKKRIDDNGSKKTGDQSTTTPPTTGAYEKYHEFDDELGIKTLLEHYQPPEFPFIPVITTKTHELTNSSWRLIKDKMYDNANSKNGKDNGSVFFYDNFFRMLFERASHLKLSFPSIMLQASVMSKVIALCLSIDYGKINLQIKQIQILGRTHRSLVRKPSNYSIYATTLLCTVNLCLGDAATLQIMNAWANVLALILRYMLPEAITNAHLDPYACALNAASNAVTRADQELIKINMKFSKESSDIMCLRSKLRGGLGSAGTAGQATDMENNLGRPENIDDASRVASSTTNKNKTINSTELDDNNKSRDPTVLVFSAAAKKPSTGTEADSSQASPTLSLTPYQPTTVSISPNTSAQGSAGARPTK